MKFTLAWANVITQNLTLRALVIALSLCSVIFGISTARLALRDPFIIERGCYSQTVSPSDVKHTDTEIESFLKLAIVARYDFSIVDIKHLLSDREITARISEHEEYLKKAMTQRIIVNSIKKERDSILVDVDRIISVEKVRSALPMQVKVELRSISRTQSNPYGLILYRVTTLQPGEVK